MFYLEAQEKIASAPDGVRGDIQGGQVIGVAEPAASTTGSKKHSGARSKRKGR